MSDAQIPISDRRRFLDDSGPGSSDVGYESLFRLLPRSLPAAVGFLLLFACDDNGGKATPTTARTTRQIAPTTAQRTVVVFEDDFSTPDRGGWRPQDSPRALREYTAGAFRIFAKTSGVFYTEPETPVLDGSLRIEADLANVSNEIAGIGLYCRFNGGLEFGQGYTGLVDSAGSWRISKDRREGEEFLNGGSVPSQVKRQIETSEYQHVGLECLGGNTPGSPVTLRLEVNGVVLGEALDAQGLPPGTAGVVLDYQGPRQVEGRIDNFRVSRL